MVARGLVVVGLVLLSLLAQAKASLSGSWTVSVDFHPASPPLEVRSSLDLDYALDDWSFGSSSTFGTTGWDALCFEATGLVGGFSLDASLEFDPRAVRFKRWKSSADWDAKGLSLSASFQITPHFVALDVSADGEADDIAFGVDVELRTRGGCALLLHGIDLSIDLPFCCANVSSEVYFSKDGFEELALAVSDIETGRLCWMSIDVDLTFEMEAKEVDLSPSFAFGENTCFDLYIDAETCGNVTLDAISIYGIGFSCDVGSVSLETLSYVDGTHKLRGKYWEMCSVAFEDDLCCGPVSLSLAAYFLEGGIGLFDVGLLESILSIALAEKMAFETTFVWNVEARVLDSLTCGFEVSW